VSGRAWQIWQEEHRTVGGTFGAIMLAFGLALFLLLVPSGKGRAHAGEVNISQGVSPAKLVPSIAGCKVDRATSTATVLSASALDESDCHDGAVRANCGLCAGGHCFGCWAVVLSAPLEIRFESKSVLLSFLDQSGLALTKPDEAFRPPSPVL
jgi:hypothetical protein